MPHSLSGCQQKLFTKKSYILQVIFYNQSYISQASNIFRKQVIYYYILQVISTFYKSYISLTIHIFLKKSYILYKFTSHIFHKQSYILYKFTSHISRKQVIYFTTSHIYFTSQQVIYLKQVIYFKRNIQLSRSARHSFTLQHWVLIRSVVSLQYTIYEYINTYRYSTTANMYKLGLKILYTIYYNIENKNMSYYTFNIVNKICL